MFLNVNLRLIFLTLPMLPSHVSSPRPRIRFHLHMARYKFYIVLYCIVSLFFTFKYSDKQGRSDGKTSSIDVRIYASIAVLACRSGDVVGVLSVGVRWQPVSHRHRNRGRYSRARLRSGGQSSAGQLRAGRVAGYQLGNGRR